MTLNLIVFIVALDKTTIGGLDRQKLREEWERAEKEEDPHNLLRKNFQVTSSGASSHLSRSGVNMLTPSPSPTPNLLEMNKMDSTHFSANLAIARKSAPPDISGIFSVLKNSNWFVYNSSMYI